MIDSIKSEPVNFYERIYQETYPGKPVPRKKSSKTSYMRKFDGGVVKTETDEYGKTTTSERDTKGEFLQKADNKKQASDTQAFLELAANGNLTPEEIEKMGYKNRGSRIKSDEAPDENL